MSNQLLPCPFCGGEAKRFTLQDEENFGGDVIICQGCDACSRVVFGEKEGLVDSWNRRATQPAVPEQYEYWSNALGCWRPAQESVEFLTSRGFKVRAVRGAEHDQ